MYCTARKFRGWAAEVAIHLPGLIRAEPPPRIDFHLPWGTRDPYAMEFDGLVWTRLAASGPAPELANLIDPVEFVASMLVLHELFPDTTLGFYLGSPESSDVFTRGWAVGNLNGIDERIDSSIRPILRLRDRMERFNIGTGRVALWIDMLCARDKDSLSAYTHARCHKLHGIPTGGETRPHKVAAWANRPDIPWVTEGGFWHHLENDPVAIPSNELKGPQWLIRSDRAAAESDLALGLNVAFIGAWSTSVPAGSS
jgi:hypothetical protein